VAYGGVVGPAPELIHGGTSEIDSAGRASHRSNRK